MPAIMLLYMLVALSLVVLFVDEYESSSTTCFHILTYLPNLLVLLSMIVLVHPPHHPMHGNIMIHSNNRQVNIFSIQHAALT